MGPLPAVASTPARRAPSAAAAGRADAELPVYARLPFVPVRGEGCWLEDAAGNRYLDLYGGHAVALTGHSHPHVVRAIAEQSRALLFYSSAVPSPAREYASALLLARAPHPGSCVFHCCSGSEANETAFKLARRATGRRTVISFAGSFHGRTLGALSACGLETYRDTAGGVLAPHHIRVPFGDLAALEAVLSVDTAAVICEPIQSLGGVRLAADGFYRELAQRVRLAGAVLVFDEVQTGLGRTGSFFFGDPLGIRPDLITLAKGLASGIPAAAVIVAPELADTVGLGDHGSTFGGGPVAMAAMRATLEVIERDGLVDNAAHVGAMLRRELATVAAVREVRGRGLLLGIVLDRPAKSVQAALLARRIVTGVSVEPPVLRLLPPLVLHEDEAALFLEALREVMTEVAA